MYNEGRCLGMVANMHASKHITLPKSSDNRQTKVLLLVVSDGMSPRVFFLELTSCLFEGR